MKSQSNPLPSIWPLLTLSLLLSCESQPIADSSTTYDLYFLGGQSNMVGYGRIDELPDSLNNPVTGVRIFHGNQRPDSGSVDGKGIWSELRPGHGVGFSSDGVSNAYSDWFGVELAFARRLKQLDPDAQIAIVKYARGGTSIDTAAQSYGTWDPDFRGGSGVNQYDHFLATIRNATAAADIDGDGRRDRLEPAGIIWMQGESDAHTPEVASRYEQHLIRLMDLMRAALREDDLPVVVGRISDSGQDDEDGRVWNHGDIVRKAQADFVASDGRARLVTSTDSYGYSDRWHYDTDGYLDLGRAFADAMASIQGSE